MGKCGIIVLTGFRHEHYADTTIFQSRIAAFFPRPSNSTTRTLNRSQHQKKISNETSAKPSINRSGVSAERRKTLEIAESRYVLFAEVSNPMKIKNRFATSAAVQNETGNFNLQDTRLFRFGQDLSANRKSLMKINLQKLFGRTLIIVFSMVLWMSFATTSIAVTYSISPNPASVNENAGSLTFTVTRSSSSGTATVYASTVQDQGYSNSGDYVGLLNQTVSFSSGQTTAQVSVTINDVGLTSGSKIFRIEVQQNSTDPIGTYLATDNFTILDNDPVAVTYSISPNPASVNENAGSLTFTITRSSSSGTATVYASTVQDQGYSNGGDYVGLANQTVNFSAGQSSAQVSVTINDLGLTSGSKIFRIEVQKNSTDPIGTYLATDNFTILDNDPVAVTYSISPNPASVNENAGSLTFTVTRSSSSGTATVYASTVQDQGYSNGGDYIGLVNQTINFSAGQSSAQVSVTINDVGLTSGSKIFRIEVQKNSTDPIATYLATDNFTILDNDPIAVTYSISPNPASVNENAGSLTFTVTRSSSSGTATVYASTVQDQGYSNGGDYVGLVNQTFNFSAGQSTAQVSVTINDQGLTSGSKIFRIEVQKNSTDPIGTYLATDNFTILDNDPAAVTYSISPNPASVNENAGSLTFTITRSSSSGTATINASTVQDQGFSNNGLYYVGVLNQTVNFSAGQTTAQVSVTINDVKAAFGSETFRFIVQQNSTDPISTYLATDNFTITNGDVPASGTKFGVDYRDSGATATTGVTVSGFTAAGKQFVCEYIGGAANDGYLRASDVEVLTNQGLQIVSIFERTPKSVSYFTIANADTDAADAIAAAILTGQPSGSAIDSYFQEIRTDFNQYFNAHPGVTFKIGVYAAGDVLPTIMNDASVGASYSWLAEPFGSPYPSPNLAQTQDSTPSNPISIGGINVDLDEAYTANFGQWGGSATLLSPPIFGNPSVSGDLLQTTLSGLSAGEKVVIYVSPDLKNWTLVQSNVVSGSTIQFTYPINPATKSQFFRATVQ